MSKDSYTKIKVMHALKKNRSIKGMIYCLKPLWNFYYNTLYHESRYM